MTLIEDIFSATIEGDADVVTNLTTQALEQGLAPTAILNDALTPAMDEVGQRYECGDLFVPEMMIAARAMKEGMGVLKPHLVADDLKPRGRIVIGTVQGDLHDIGKNLVAMMLEGAGYEVHDLGVDVPTDKFVEAAADGVQAVALSALLTTTMPAMEAVIQGLEEAGIRDRVKVVIGGAPITQDYAASIHADGFAPDAGSAVTCIRELLNGA